MRTRTLDDLSDADMEALLSLIFNTDDCPVCAPAFTDADCTLCEGNGFLWRAVGAKDDEEQNIL